MPLKSFGDTYSGPHRIPGSWASGAYLAWPNGNRGLLATLQAAEGRTELVNLSPLAEYGVHVGIEIERVHAWSSGSEAQMEGTWGEALARIAHQVWLASLLRPKRGRTIP